MNGWVSGFLWMAIIGLSNIVGKLVADHSLHVVVYVSQGMLAGAFVLLFFSKPGRLAIETVRNPNTWIYGWFFLIFNSLAIYTLRFVDVAVLMQLQRFATVLTFFLVWAFLGRVSRVRLSLFFQTLILIGVVVMAFGLPSEALGLVLATTFLMCILQSVKTIAVEMHEPNNAAQTLEQEVRVTAYMMAITGGISYTIIFVMSFLNDKFSAGIATGVIPSLDEFFNPYSLIFASIYGFFAFSAMRFLEFYTIKRIKSEGFMTLLAFLPLFGFAAEFLADTFGVVQMHTRGFSLLQGISLTLIVLGSLGIILFCRSKKSGRTNVNHRIVQMSRDHQLAAHTLQYCDGNKERAAQLLGLTTGMLETALYEKDVEKALPLEVSQRLHNQYTQNISFLDNLTGLINKTYFMSIFNDVLRRGDHGAVLLLDLNQFKQVNDTYGHQAGDETLKEVAKRLQVATGRNAVHTRLGGDEFAILLTNATLEKIKNIEESLKVKLLEPITIPGVEEAVSVGASIGVANFPDDGADASVLLHKADQKMYAIKKEKRQA